MKQTFPTSNYKGGDKRHVERVERFFKSKSPSSRNDCALWPLDSKQADILKRILGVYAYREIYYLIGGVLLVGVCWGWVCLVIWLNVVAFPLGAILFYCFLIPGSALAGAVDYATKKRKNV